MSTKDSILKILLKNQNSSISGEKLAEICNVSRAAIWKAVNNLRNEGYKIDGIQNGGYILKNSEEVFSAESFKNKFNKEFPEFAQNKVDFFSEIDSTNSYAKRILQNSGDFYDFSGNLTSDGKEFSNRIIFADSQTQGRGRFGRTFISPQKSGIYVSIIYAPKEGITNPGIITAFSAVAVSRAIKNVFNIQPQIKWINDLYLNNKKICGILTEGIVDFERNKISSCVIGIGINIFQNKHFSEELKKIAGGILQNSEEISSNRINLLVQVCGQVLKIFSENKSHIIEEYKQNSFLIGKNITVFPVAGTQNNSYSAKVIDIDENAHLVIKTESEEIKSLESGEVSVKIL